MDYAFLVSVWVMLILQAHEKHSSGTEIGEQGKSNGSGQTAPGDQPNFVGIYKDPVSVATLSTCGRKAEGRRE